jgi:hypothetical protein
VNFFIIIFFLISTYIFPDTINLKNGTKITASLIENSNKFFIYKDINGIIKTIPKEEVISIEPGEFPEALIKSNTEKNNKKEESDFSFHLSNEVVSDFIWRGNSYGGEYLSRRNDMAYKSITQYWAYQPTLRINTPAKGFYSELWGNIPLVGLSDRDSDLRAIQASPGSPSINPNFLIANSNSGIDQLSNPANNIYNDKCIIQDSSNVTAVDFNSRTTQTALSQNPNPSSCMVDPRKLGPKKEKNGLYRTGGLFTTFAYNYNSNKYGSLTLGTWFYFQTDKSNMYSWQEYFTWWTLPWARTINPTISWYVQVSLQSNNSTGGGQYLSYSMNHTFFEGKFFRIQPAWNIGYKWPNNNISQRSGIYDITTNIKFLFGDFFASLNWAYRPNLYMYDNNYFYYQNSINSPALSNISQNDGRTVDPSKLYGPVNQAVYDRIDSLNVVGIIKDFIKQEYQNQKIVQNLFWIGFGYNMNF